MAVPGVAGFALGPALERVPVEVGRESRGDGVQVLRVNAPGMSAVGLTLDCRPDEHFAGFGEQFAQVDKRGRVVDGWLGASVNVPAQFAFGLDGGYKIAPLYFSSAGYAAFLQTTLRWRFDMAATDPQHVTVTVPSDELELWLVEGWPADAIPRVTAVTGRPPLVQPWVYGAWKNLLGTEEHVLAEALRTREERLPCSAVWLYAFYEPRTNTGCGAGGTYGTGEFPDLAGTVDRLHELGFKALTYLNAWLFKGTPRFQEALERGYLIKDAEGRPILDTSMHPVGGDETDRYDELLLHTMENGTGYVDFTNPDARAWWQSLLREVLLGEGFDGWMEDFGEGIPAGARLHDGTGPEESHNRYPLLYHAAAHEEIQRSKPGAAFFARSGYLGSQAFTTVFWPGDQTRDWSRDAGIGCVPAAGISLGLMGVAAWGPDITGCMGFKALGGGHGGGPQDEELWIRWCQLGAMTPVMREHLGFHDATPVDAWTSAATLDTWRRAAGWHLQLFPYLYALAEEASRTGLPILRGMMLEFPYDPECWILNDQYLLGPALLCAPVLERGARERRVYLPRGAWYDWWTGERHEGPGRVTVPAPLERWPVLQRAGTSVPLLRDVPLDLNDERYANGDYDVEVRVRP